MTDVLTTAECAALLRVSERHVRTLVSRGALPVAVADPIRVPRAAIERLLAAADWQPAPLQHPVAPERRVRPLPPLGPHRLTLRDLAEQRDAERAAHKAQRAEAGAAPARRQKRRTG